MIRINLLPQKKRRAESGGGGDMWVLAAFGVVLVEIVVLFVYQGMKEAELAEERQKNDRITAQIAQSKAAVANHAAVKQELEQMRAREEAIAKLQSARSGPTAVLLEIGRMLTPGRGPTIDAEKLAQVRRDNPLSVFNPSWDSRRLWITSFIEERRLLKVQGVARDGSDVSELARRMNLSDYFSNVRLLPGRKGTDRETGLEIVDFALEAEVKY
jgi:type IV pilus assembly protein PilN